MEISLFHKRVRYVNGLIKHNSVKIEVELNSACVHMYYVDVVPIYFLF